MATQKPNTSSGRSSRGGRRRGGDGSDDGQLYVRHRRMRQDAQSGAFKGPLVGVIVDDTEIRKLMQAMRDAGHNFRARDRRMTFALNKGMDQLHKRLVTDQHKWTGLVGEGDVKARMGKVPSSSGRWTAKVTFKRNRAPVTKGLFNAAWTRGSAGGTHQAWSRTTTAEGTFMLPGKSHLVKRTGLDKWVETKGGKRVRRSGLKTIWGSSTAREAARHKPFVRARIRRELRVVVIPLAYKAIDYVFKAEKAKSGL